MNRLPLNDRIACLSQLVDGASMRAIARTVGVAKNTVPRLLEAAASACWAFHNETVRQVRATQVEADELWAFCYKKEKNVAEDGPESHGDLWTWTAMDVASRLMICWAVGDRTRVTAVPFFEDLYQRLDYPVPITTDQYNVYHHRLMIRVPDPIDEEEEDVELPSTSRVERNNLTMRMGMRRYTRKTNAFSKTLKRHEMMLALFFVHYNFVRVHGSIGTTPAHWVGLAERPYDMEWLAKMIEAACPKPNRPKRYKIYPKEPLRRRFL